MKKATAKPRANSKRAASSVLSKRVSRPVNVRSFAVAQTDRILRGWGWDGGYSAHEIRWQLSTIRARSREMSKNNPHMKRWLQLVGINTVGEGFGLKSTPHDGMPGAKDYRLDTMAAKFIEAHWWRFCNQRDPATNATYCDATGRKTMAEIDLLNAKTEARDGEYFMLPQPASNPYGITFRIVRPDACDETYFREASGSSNPVFCGVEIDRNTGRKVAYYFHTTEPQSGYSTLRGTPLMRVPAEQVIHGFEAEDEDQTRGIPQGHAALVKLKMLEAYDKAELTAAWDEACSVRTYYADRGDPEGFIDLTSEEYRDVAGGFVADKESGQSEILPPGWRQEVHVPQHPNREVTPFKAGMIKDVSCGFGVEYSGFSNDWAGVSFSSVRVGTIAERDMWIVRQNRYIAQCKTPAFLMWLKSFLASEISGGFPAEKFAKFAEHEFRGRRWMWVDPMRDMRAAEVAVAHGWKTNTQIAADVGADYDDNVDEIRREKETAKGVIGNEQESKPVQAV